MCPTREGGRGGRQRGARWAILLRARRWPAESIGRLPCLVVVELTGLVKLVNDADAAQARKFSQRGEVRRAVPLARGKGAIPQPVKGHGHFDGERVAVEDVHVQRVELGQRERIDDGAQRGQRQELPRGIHHHPAPGKGRLVGYGDGRGIHPVRARVKVISHELRQRLQSEQRAPHGGCGNAAGGAVRRQVQRVTLIDAQVQRHGDVGNVDDDGRENGRAAPAARAARRARRRGAGRRPVAEDDGLEARKGGGQLRTGHHRAQLQRRGDDERRVAAGERARHRPQRRRQRRRRVRHAQVEVHRVRPERLLPLFQPPVRVEADAARRRVAQARQRADVAAELRLREDRLVVPGDVRRRKVDVGGISDREQLQQLQQEQERGHHLSPEHTRRRPSPGCWS